MSKTLHWAAADVARPWSATLLYLAARILTAGSDVLTRLAARVSAAEKVTGVHVHTVEFHPVYRDAGAPEGALYINGELVGVIEGVTRL